uniref:ATP-binding protein n=1 Tax=Pseudomonas syringae TaxID=317 RepID=UPI001E3CBC1C|nr:GTPase domain-containing protein [Pseudomonas syringae]QOQ33470.1 hypothetical protein [Pseudomonas syringae pv. actinidiae]
MRNNSNTVILITGRTGVGKSTLLDRFVKKHVGDVQLFRPKNLSGDLFDLSAIDWANHAAVVVDEVGNWDRSSIRSAIKVLEAESLKTGKKLVLVSMFPADLEHYGVELSSKPLIFELTKPNNVSSLPFKFDGTHLHFKVDACTEQTA